jgi:fatty acid desaturase
MKKIDFIINIVTAMLFIAIAVGCFGAFLWGWRFHLILLGVMSSYAGYVMITGTLDDMEDNNKK